MAHFGIRRRRIALLLAGWGLIACATGCTETLSPAPAAAFGEFVEQIDSQPQAGGSGEMKPFALIAVNSYQKLMGNVSFLGSLMGMRDANLIAEAQILQLIQDKGLNSIDKNRPWGALLQTDGMAFSAFALVPTAKPDDLFAVVAENGVQVNSTPAGLRQLTLPNGMPLFAKSEAGWTLISDSEQSLARAPANFQADLAQLSNDYDLAATLMVQNLPEMLRQMALGWVRDGVNTALAAQAENDPEEAARKRAEAEARILEIEKSLQQTDKLTIGMKLDATLQRGYFDTVVQVVPGSDLAKQIQAQGESRTNFAGFRPEDAAGLISFTTQVDADSLQQMRDSRETVRKSMLDSLDQDENIPEAMREAVKSAASDFLDAAMATAESGRLDGAGSVRVSADALTVIAGMRIKDTEKLVSGLKKFEAAVKQQAPDAPSIHWNAAQHGDVAFHTLSVPMPPEADESLKRMVGDQIEVAVGIGTETAYLAMGRNHLAAVQKAIDASKADANKSVPMFEAAISLRPILTLAATHAENPDTKMTLQMVAATLQNVAGGRDHIRVQGEIIPNGQRVRFEAEQGALQAVAQAVMLFQMRALGGR